MKIGKPKAKHSVTFYSKRNCCLCDEARDMLEDLDRDFHLEINEIDINSDLLLYERYKNIIPVVIIDGSFTTGGRIDREELLDYLEGNL